MDWSVVVVQWLHILFGTFWFGGSLFANFVMVPAILRLPADGQRRIIELVGEQGNRVIPWAAAATIVLGFLRGTVLGDIKDVSGLSTTYGVLWLVGLIAAVATFAWGQWVLGPAAEHLTASGVSMGSSEGASPEAGAAISRVRSMALLELIGFFVIFTTMILMHFAGEA